MDNRYEFAMLYDVKNGNPNGDPDADNAPRSNPETGKGFITDVCTKRKIRNYISITRDEAPGFDIFIKEKAVLNNIIEKYSKSDDSSGVEPTDTIANNQGAPGIEHTATDPVADGQDQLENNDELSAKQKSKSKKGVKKEKKKNSEKERDSAQKEMTKAFWDIRTFGAVLTTGMNAGQVRGPVQIAFAESIDPILDISCTITRCAVATQDEADNQDGENHTMGKKSIVPYALYRQHGFISPFFADKTNFNDDDLNLLWEAILNMFEHDHSATRGEMNFRKLIIFKHQTKLGDCPSSDCFARVEVIRKDYTKSPNQFSDYQILIDGREMTGQKIELDALRAV